MRPIRTSSGVHDTVEDLIRLLDDNPEWAEALRSRAAPGRSPTRRQAGTGTVMRPWAPGPKSALA